MNTGFYVSLTLLLIAVGYGIIKKKADRTYWIASLGAVMSNFLAHFLFEAGGDLGNPTGDGIITAMLRQTSNDGPSVLIALPFAIILGYVVPFYLARKILKNKANS